jgi:hypothetical protein
MGWLFTVGSTRRELIAERTQDWQRASNEMLVDSKCLAHCFRGGRFSGVLWSVWERTLTKDGHEVEPTQRWIACDLLQYSRSNEGWGFKDMEESMGPYFYSCPLGYLEMVPIEQFGGNEEWRNGVRSHHQRLKEKRQGTRSPQA